MKRAKPELDPAPQVGDGGAQQSHLAPEAVPAQTTRSKVLSWAKTLGIMLVAYGAIHMWQTRNLASGPAPDVSATTLDGAQVSLGAATGEARAVHFWASWCGVCSVMESNIESVAQSGDAITVASGSGQANAVRSHLAENELEMDALVDPDSAIARRFGVSAYPTTIIMNPDGEIVFRTVGYTTWLGLRARLFVAQFL